MHENSYVLSRIIAAVSGTDLRDFLMPRLFEPLAIGNPQWHRCPLGFSIGAVGLALRTDEIARLDARCCTAAHTKVVSWFRPATWT